MWDPLILKIDPIWNNVSTLIDENCIEFAVFILLLDPVIILLAMISTTLDKIENEENEENKDIAIIITAHNSENIIKNTIESCLHHVDGQQIFVCDNNNNNTPTDKTWDKIYEINPNINYHYNNVGNKTRAQFMGIMSKKNVYKYYRIHY